MAQAFFQRIGVGVASLTFGVALSIFIYAAAAGLVSGASAWLLFGATFLLMLRFWWRYIGLFVRWAPSQTYWHFLLDFAISFFGIAAVLFVSAVQTWAALGAAAMAASMVRCALAWKDANAKIRQELKKTLLGASGVAMLMGAVWALAPLVENTLLATGAFVLVLTFVIWAAKTEHKPKI